MKDPEIYHGAELDLERFIGYDVLDRSGEDIGDISAFWTDEIGRPAFIGIKTSWLMGKTHVIPAEAAEVNHAQQHIRVPFTNEEVKGAPNYDPDVELDSATEHKVIGYFQGKGMPAWSGRERTASGSERMGAEEARIPVHEEELSVGKRAVETGGIRLRKVVRRETVQQPVELKREDVVVERVPTGESQATGRTPEASGRAFEGEEVYIPLWEEEPVVSKDVRVREEVRARKTEESESRTVSGETRKEDVEIEDERKRS